MKYRISLVRNFKNFFKTSFVIAFILISFFGNAQKQTVSGTRWEITVVNISSKPFNFIFGTTGNKGNVLYPDSTLVDFTWSEDDNGNWSIIVERMVKGVHKTETFFGKISGNVGSGFYTNTADRKKLLPLKMVKLSIH